nr:sporulation-delaying protein SdpB family protein [uncultured Allomuricauda sp.]
MFRFQWNKLIVYYEKTISIFIAENPFTNLYGLARSLLAFGTLTIFIFNDISFLFDKAIIESMSNSSFLFTKLNLFVSLGWDNLIYARILSIIVLITVIVGYFPQVTAILHWYIAFSLQNGGSIIDGGDQINSILTAFIVPIAILDNRKNHWDKPKNNVSDYRKIIAHFMFMLISLQMSFLYFHSAVEKLYGTEHWTNGTALYYIFNDPTFGLSKTFYGLISFVIQNKFVVIMTWSVLILELFISYNLMARRNKRVFAFYIGFLFHFSIAFFFGLISFGFAMTAGLCLFALPYNNFVGKLSLSYFKV